MSSSTALINKGLHRFSVFTVGATLFLILAGGLVTSTGSGLAVPDWPLSYGMVFPPMVGGVFYEHGHRMVAAFVGVLTVILTVLLWKKDQRRWVRGLGVIALCMVVIQGLLGGLTVLYLLPTFISVAHACLAQTFFCILIWISLSTSSSWEEVLEPLKDSKGISLKGLASVTFIVVYLQLFLGALVRHTESGLAIPDFPLSFGRLIPSVGLLTIDPVAPFPISLEEFRVRVWIQFVHRAWAGVVLFAVIWTSIRILRFHINRWKIVAPALSLLGLVLIQISLGALIIWTEKEIVTTTAHVVVGALVLASSLVLVLRCWRMTASKIIDKYIEPQISRESVV